MNLHGTVRGAITSVNPDIIAPWIQSVAATVAVGGKQTPTYAAPLPVKMQVQAASGRELEHYDFQAAQGIFRSVYLYGLKNGVDRVEGKGGDLLQFPEVPKGTVRTWLVVAVPEPYSLTAHWCRVLVQLQLDPSNPV